jgi:hypothetical protein
MDLWILDRGLDGVFRLDFFKAGTVEQSKQLVSNIKPCSGLFPLECNSIKVILGVAAKCQEICHLLKLWISQQFFS